MYVHKIMAGPGAGKTLTLIELAETALRGGREPEDIGFVSFSRAAVHEARDRAIQTLDLPAKRFPWWRTLHSAAYRLLGVRRGQLVTEKKLKAFGDAYRYRFTEQQEMDPESYEHQPRGATGDGDQLIAWYDWYRHTLQPSVDIGMRRSNRVGSDVLGSEAQIARFIDRYEDWKRDGGLIDFTDLLTRCRESGMSPPVSVLLADEQQDNTPLESALIEQFAQHCAYLIICGDPNQAIYSWAGADGAWLRERQADSVEMLPSSHRIPRAVKQLAAGVIGQARQYVPTAWTPRDADGRVERGSDLDSLSLDNGARWFVLVRNRYLLPSFVKALTARAIPFDNRSGVSAFDEPHELAGVVAALRLADGEFVSIGDARLMLRHAVPQKAGVGVLWQRGAGKQLEELADRYEDAHVDLDRLPGVTDLLTTMLRDGQARWQCFGKVRNRARLGAMRAIYERHGVAGLAEKPAVTLSTIHAAKGREAEHVVICPDMSARTYRGMLASPDAEHRVWYVAATRAFESVHVLAPRNGRAYAL